MFYGAPVPPVNRFVRALIFDVNLVPATCDGAGENAIWDDQCGRQARVDIIGRRNKNCYRERFRSVRTSGGRSGCRT